MFLWPWCTRTQFLGHIASKTHSLICNISISSDGYQRRTWSSTDVKPSYAATYTHSYTCGPAKMSHTGRVKLAIFCHQLISGTRFELCISILQSIVTAGLIGHDTCIESQESWVWSDLKMVLRINKQSSSLHISPHKNHEFTHESFLPIFVLIIIQISGPSSIVADVMDEDSSSCCCNPWSTGLLWLIGDSTHAEVDECLLFNMF